VILLYSKLVTEEIIRLQANGFSAEETRTYLKENNNINPGLNTIYRHRKSPIGLEMLNELIRHQKRSILKADASDPALAMNYRDKLIGKYMDKLMPDLAYVATDTTINAKVEVIKHIDGLNSDEQHLLDQVTRKFIKAEHKTESASIH
jgi:hypothetical protein